MTCQHIGLVCPQDIGIGANSSGVIVPLGLFGESSHVIPDTQDLFLGQCIKLAQEHNRFITMTLEKSVRVILPLILRVQFSSVQEWKIPTK